MHFRASSHYGPYWSITRFDDIMAVEFDHETFSSRGHITIDDEDVDFETPMFISMDPPKHEAHHQLAGDQ